MSIQTHTNVIDKRQQINEKEENLNKWDFGNVNSAEWLKLQPRFKNLKEEVLKNKYAPISKNKWNDILSKSLNILNFHVGSNERIRFSQILKRNNIKLRHILAIKLYCDEDNLQREFRKCFISKYQNDEDYKERLSQFANWRKELHLAFKQLSKISFLNKNKNKNKNESQTQTLYHGSSTKYISNCKNRMDTFYGPLSTTTDINVAREFAGKNGMILIIKPNNKDAIYKSLDISYISDYPNEKEVLLLNHDIYIQDYIYSTDYDNNYSLYNMSNKEMLQSLKNNINSSKSNPINKNNNTIHIGNDDININQNNNNNNLNLIINNDASVYLLCAIYKYAQDFVYNVTKYKRIQKEIIFNSISIPKDLYHEFLNYQCINSSQCTHVLSEYIRVSS